MPQRPEDTHPPRKPPVFPSQPPPQTRDLGAGLNPGTESASLDQGDEQMFRLHPFG